MGIKKKGEYGSKERDEYGNKEGSGGHDRGSKERPMGIKRGLTPTN